MFLETYSWQVVFSLRSNLEENINKWTFSPDLVAADSRAHASLGVKEALPDVSTMKRPFSIELTTSGSSESCYRFNCFRLKTLTNTLKRDRLLTPLSIGLFGHHELFIWGPDSSVLNIHLFNKLFSTSLR